MNRLSFGSGARSDFPVMILTMSSPMLCACFIKRFGSDALSRNKTATAPTKSSRATPINGPSAFVDCAASFSSLLLCDIIFPGDSNLLVLQCLDGVQQTNWQALKNGEVGCLSPLQVAWLTQLSV